MTRSLDRRTEIFVVRLWAEYLEQENSTWRGEIEHMGSRRHLRFASVERMVQWMEQLAGGEEAGRPVSGTPEPPTP